MRRERAVGLGLVALVLGCGGTEISHLDGAMLPDVGSEVSDGWDVERSPDAATEIGTSDASRDEAREVLMDANEATDASEAGLGESPSCGGGLDCGGVSCCLSIPLPGGTFTLGNNYGDKRCPVDGECSIDEVPAHPATLSPFALDAMAGHLRTYPGAA